MISFIVKESLKFFLTHCRKYIVLLQLKIRFIEFMRVYVIPEQLQCNPKKEHDLEQYNLDNLEHYKTGTPHKWLKNC